MPDSLNGDGTHTWTHTATPVDQVALALSEVIRARTHVDVAVRELSDKILKLMQAAKGGHT